VATQPADNSGSKALKADPSMKRKPAGFFFHEQWGKFHFSANAKQATTITTLAGGIVTG
jgi:hypothetical protein